VLNHV
jgi:F0F1-type ATP synthase alpha subunit